MRLVETELRRFASRRIVRGALLLIVLVMLVVVTIQAVRGRAPREQVPTFTGDVYLTPDTRLDVHKSLPPALEGVGVALVFVGFVVGASFVGAEHHAGSLTTQFLYEPRRWVVHLAKAAAVGAGTVALAAVALAVLAGALYAGAELRGVVHDVDTSWWWRRAGQAGRIAGACGLGAVMAYGVTLVARRTSAGVIAFFLQYPLLFLVHPRSEPFGPLSHYAPVRGLLAVVVDPSGENAVGDGAIRTLAGGVVLATLWSAVIVFGSGQFFARAEVR